jgi:putative heme-binding domain-containing protein
MTHSRLALLWFLVLAGTPNLFAENVQHGLRLPAGFEVTEYADSQLANDIYCMTLDPKGRVVVSGRGYIKVLVEDAKSGKATRAVEVAAGPRDGAMGLFWEGEWLYFTGDGGLRRYRIPKGEDRAVGPSELIRRLKTGGEHDAHAIRRGPDGWLYVLCGNMTGVNKSHAELATSPIKDPVAGCVLRFTPDLKKSEIVVDGFRNAYGMDFNLDGELFTFDSDNERCVSLPWYESIRFYHVLPGSHYGWQAPQRGQWWRRPPYFRDVVAPVATFGRGSPTGVACYPHVQFPPAYRGGIFLLDWTFGRVYFAKLKPSGSTYRCEKQLFLESVGDNGFAPTAIVVHPATGDLFISIGGRGTRGAVYRIRYPKGMKSVRAADLARLQIRPRSLDWRPDLLRPTLQQAQAQDALQRRNALSYIQRHWQKFKIEQIEAAVRANWDHSDRYLRQLAAGLLAVLPRRERRKLATKAKTPAQQLTVSFAQKAGEPSADLGRAAAILAASTNGRTDRLDAVRLIQRALGDLMSPKVTGTVWEGYFPRRFPLWPDSEEARLAPAGDRYPSRLDKAAFGKAVTALRGAFPSGDADLDREISRTLAVLEDDDPAILTKIAGRLTAKSDPIEDIHYLIVLARLRAARSSALTRATAGALLALDAKITRRHLNRDRHWPLRMAEVFAELTRKDPKLANAVLAHVDFGRPSHALFVKRDVPHRQRAAAVFLARAKKDADFEWTPALVDLVASLPDEQIFPVLRRLWDRGGLEDSILAVLARKPQAQDRNKFLDGLNAPQLAMVRRSLEALEKLPPPRGGDQLLPLVKAFRRLGEEKEEKRLAQQLAKYLQKVTGETRAGADKKAWAAWFTKKYPALAARLGNEDGVDVAGWNKRLASLDWSAGDAGRGQRIFTRVSCASCHSGGQALGPDLRGVAGRFSRADLFTAILQPSKDVSPRYRTTQVTTAAGKVYQGLIIYEAVDSLILQTGPATTIRIANKQIAERRVTALSLMPTGLIDKLTDREIADLYAYLKSLGNAASKKNKKPREK